MKKRRPNGYRLFEKNLRLFILDCVHTCTKKYTLAEIQIFPDYNNIETRGRIRWIRVKIIINGVKLDRWKFIIQDSQYSWLTKETFALSLRKRFTICKLRKK